MPSEVEKNSEEVGKADNNKEQATKEQTKNENMILNKDENIEKTKSEGEAKGEDEEYGKPNQQYQKNQKGIAAETKTKEKENENQGDKTSTGEEDKNKKPSKTNILYTRHFKSHQETLLEKKIEPELKEEEQTEN